jgi:hypothetical protein
LKHSQKLPAIALAVSITPIKSHPNLSMALQQFILGYKRLQELNNYLQFINHRDNIIQPYLIEHDKQWQEVRKKTLFQTLLCLYPPSQALFQGNDEKNDSNNFLSSEEIELYNSYRVQLSSLGMLSADTNCPYKQNFCEFNTLKQRVLAAVDLLPNREAEQKFFTCITAHPFAASPFDVSAVAKFVQINVAELEEFSAAQYNSGDLLSLNDYRNCDTFFWHKTIKGVWQQIQRKWEQRCENNKAPTNNNGGQGRSAGKHNFKFEFDNKYFTLDSDKFEYILVKSTGEYGYNIPYLFNLGEQNCQNQGFYAEHIDINFILQAGSDHPLQHENPQLIQRILGEIQQQRADTQDSSDSEQGQYSEGCVAIHDYSEGDKIFFTKVADNTINDAGQPRAAVDLYNNYDIFCSRNLLSAAKQYNLQAALYQLRAHCNHPIADTMPLLLLIAEYAAGIMQLRY